MGSAVVSNTILAGGQPVEGATATITLFPAQPAFSPTGQEIGNPPPLTTDTNGTWTATLERTDTMLPSDMVYQIVERLPSGQTLKNTFAVGAAGGELANLLTVPPADASAVTGQNMTFNTVTAGILDTGGAEINLMSQGALGDGSDDSAAFLRGLAKLATLGRGKLFVPPPKPGVYGYGIKQQLVIAHSNITIEGAGGYASIISALSGFPPNTDMVVVADGVNNTKLLRFGIDGQGIVTGSKLRLLTPPTTGIGHDGLETDDFIVTGWYTDPTSVPTVQIDNLSNARIRWLSVEGGLPFPGRWQNLGSTPGNVCNSTIGCMMTRPGPHQPVQGFFFENVAHAIFERLQPGANDWTRGTALTFHNCANIVVLDVDLEQWLLGILIYGDTPGASRQIKILDGYVASTNGLQLQGYECENEIACLFSGAGGNPNVGTGTGVRSTTVASPGGKPSSVNGSSLDPGTFASDFAITNPGRLRRDLVHGFSPDAPRVLSPSGSPYTYANLDGYAESVIVSGGTVSAITVRGQNVGLTSGSFRLALGDSIVVTYTGTPAMVVVPE